MTAASTAFLLIAAITITIINISSTTMYGVTPNGTCLSPGAPCGPQGPKNNCTGTCDCKVHNDMYTSSPYICWEPGHPASSTGR
uniref:Putative secreted peptide n=1 Tax=Rhipicephalus pulchellus TaxID=72859 RepID=L7M9C0_RHIPC